VAAPVALGGMEGGVMTTVVLLIGIVALAAFIVVGLLQD